MYIYNYGAIGETIRAKIDGYKQEVQGGERNNASFGDVLKTYLTDTHKEKKVVSAVGNNSFSNDASVQNVTGSTLLYAMGNSETDDIAGKVLSSLGFSAYSEGSSALKATADELTVSAEQLVKANAAGGDTTRAASEFVSDFNKLMTILAAEGTSSAYLYKTTLSAAVTAGGEALTEAGLNFDNGQLSYTGSGTGIPDSFINTVASSANMISAYASAADNDDEGGISDYYATLMNSMI